MKAGLGARPHCTCGAVQNFDYEEAARRLGCTPRFLQDRIKVLVHQKYGQSVAFCDCELRLIQATFTVTPAGASAPAPQEGAAVASTLRSIKPARRRGSAIAATG